MKFVTLNSIICSIIIITSAQVFGLLYNSFGIEGESGAFITSTTALIMPALGIEMIGAIYIYQIIIFVKNEFIRTNKFIFILMTISAIMMVYPLLNRFFNIGITDKIYETTGLYIFSNTPSMYISFTFVFLFLTQLYVYLHKNKYTKKN